MTSKNLTCVLVDHEIADLETLADYVKQIPYLVLKATFDKPIEALSYLLKTPTDLLITEVDMPKISGIELCESIYKKGSTQVIFISSHADKMMQALEYCVTDYLHKPVSLVRLEKATEKAFFFSNVNKKSFENLPTDILETALEKYSTLGEAEKKVLELISGGNSTQKIAELVFTSLRTIESHRYTIRKKLKLLPDVSLTEIAVFIMERIK